MFNESVCHAKQRHPNCELYTSIRSDDIMLRDIVTHNNNSYVGYGWSNTNYPDVDVFYVIPKKII